MNTKFEQIDVRFTRIDEKFAEIDARFISLEERQMEAMRNMQTELLSGFEAFSTGFTIRLRKIEVDQSNLDALLSGRVEVVEKRLREIEQRLGGAK
jgi:hypothetical protein